MFLSIRKGLKTDQYSNMIINRLKSFLFSFISKFNLKKLQKIYLFYLLINRLNRVPIIPE